MNLEAFVAKLGAAGVEATKAIGDYSHDRLCSLFKETKDGVFEPEMMKVRVGGHDAEVPLVTLMPESRIDIDTMEVQFKSTISMKGDDIRMHSHRGLFRRCLDVDVKVVFRAKPNAEATELIREAANRRLSLELSGHLPQDNEENE